MFTLLLYTAREHSVFQAFVHYWHPCPL